MESKGDVFYGNLVFFYMKESFKLGCVLLFVYMGFVDLMLIVINIKCFNLKRFLKRFLNVEFFIF